MLECNRICGVGIGVVGVYVLITSSLTGAKSPRGLHHMEREQRKASHPAPHNHFIRTAFSHGTSLCFAAIGSKSLSQNIEPVPKKRKPKSTPPPQKTNTTCSMLNMSLKQRMKSKQENPMLRPRLTFWKPLWVLFKPRARPN